MKASSALQIGLAGILVVCALESSAQETPPPFEDRIEVTLVEVPVTVSDRNGEPVRGLTTSNFEIFDQGKKVAISYFELIDVEELTVTAPRAINSAVRLHVVLLFDLSNSAPGNLERIREAARNFVTHQLRPHDLVAAATFSVDHGFRMLTSFTSDRDLLGLAIDTLGDPKYFRAGDPLLLSALNLPEPAGMPTTSPDVGRTPTGEEEFIEQMIDFDRMNRETHDQYLRKRLRVQFETLGSFARILDGIHGRKQVVLLSEGFDPRLVHGRETTAAEAMVDSESVLHGQVWRVSSDQRYGTTESKTDLAAMADLFRRSDVVLHAIDIRGLRTNVDASAGYRRVSNEALFLMTHPTGGQVFKNANDLGESLERLMRQQSVVYLLGFHASAGSKPGSFHDLGVRLVDVPGAKASHRAGYYEPSATSSALERKLGAADILLGDIPQRDIPLSCLVVPFPLPNEESKIPVIVEIPGDALAEGLEAGSLEAEVYVYAFDGNSAVRDYLHQRVTLDLDKVRETLFRTGVKFYGVLTLPPGDYAVKSLVIVSGTERKGFARQAVRIPEEGEALLLPPLLLEDEGQWIMVKARPRTTYEVPYPFYLGNESFVPSAGARLRANTSYKVALFARNLDYDDARIRAGVRNARGEAEHAGLSVVGRSGRVDEINKLVLRLDTAGLEPGRYYLDFALDTGSSGHRSSMPFEIEMR